MIAGPVLAWLLIPDGGLGLRDCPFCAEPIKRAAVVCRYCRREVSGPNRAGAATGGRDAS